MKTLLTLITAILISLSANAQKFGMKINGIPIEKKLEKELRFNQEFCEGENCEYYIEILFSGSYSFVKNGYRGYYIIYDKGRSEIYRSEKWKAGGYGAAAENYIVKKVLKDLAKQKKEKKL